MRWLLADGEAAPFDAPARQVLLAEDDPLLRRLYRVWLAMAGYDVRVAADGADALEAVVVHGLPDVAVLDVQMPRVDGLAVCRSLRERSPKLPIVVVSALEDDELEAAARAAGADVVLTKPASIDELCDAVEWCGSEAI